LLALAGGDRAAIAACIHPDYVNHEAQPESLEAVLRGPEEFRGTSRFLRAAFSDLRFEVEQVVAEHDFVVLEVVTRGKHTGPFRSLPPTGRELAMAQSHRYRFADGLIVEHWANRDDVGFMAQLGLAPSGRVGLG
jgi:predicted ester cyclase